MRKQIFIYNPTAGGGLAEQAISLIKTFAHEERKLHEIEIIRTDAPGKARRYAEMYSRVYSENTIYSVGGDGTLNEIVNGIYPNTKLGIVPAGSGNDFYRVYKEIEGTKKINLGVVNGRKFVNIASLGIDAKMADTANKIKKSRFKMLSYPRAIVEEIVKYKPDLIAIDGVQTESTILTFCNGKFYGNGFPMNPEYSLSDGLLNVISAGKLTRRQIICLLLRILKQTHLQSDKVSFCQTKSLLVESDNPLLCNVDGEIFTDTRFEFSIIEDGVTLTTDVPQYVKRAIKAIK